MLAKYFIILILTKSQITFRDILNKEIVWFWFRIKCDVYTFVDLILEFLTTD